MMATPKSDSEDALEHAVVDLFSEFKFDTINAYDEINGVNYFDRETLDEVVLVSRLRPALEELNSDLPPEAIQVAIEELTRDRSLLTLEHANQQIYDLLKAGVPVTFRNDRGEETPERVQVINWKEPTQNDLLAVQQFWVLRLDGLYKRRADVVLFVNGLPLVFIELKTMHRNVKNAYDGNLKDYKDTIPHIFWYNAFIILSNGRRSRMGSITATWEHFVQWKKVADEREQGRIDLETMLRGTCAPHRLLDLIENFVLFEQTGQGLRKLVAKNHQYLGVNNAIEAVHYIRENQGRLGVFWHTQGSGKSFSAVFFSQKVLRKIPGNWSFLVVTDRDDLDEQIYGKFADVGAVPRSQGKNNDMRAQSGEDLKRLLRGDSRYVFTLIQKFHNRDGNPYPVLSEREDIIVMADEAHRSQYDIFAANMRAALPNAAFIGFTGTPLMAGEEKTRQEFGEYVSVYNFRQSVEDGATVPLFYENRIPQLQIINEDFNQDIETLLDEATLDDAQEEKLEREFSREYHLITRENRLETIAEDIVQHYMARGYAGREHNSKAMVVTVDKLTAVRMYHLVQRFWNEAIPKLQSELAAATDDEHRERLNAQIEFMQATDMAVVISQEQNEIDKFRQYGLDILPHRKRMVEEELDVKFKDPNHPFRMVFVCAMWMTGFDAPACSTIYLDKPMRNHTLMQTIARANRVFKEKRDGLIVDYIGVFREMEKALAIYGSASGGGVEEGDLPVQQKQQRVNELQRALEEAIDFCTQHSVDLSKLEQAEGFDREKLKVDAVEALLVSEDVKQQFFALAKRVDDLYKSILPDRAASAFYSPRRLLTVIADAIRSDSADTDISAVSSDVVGLLDESIIADRYVIEPQPTDLSRRVDLSQIDFDALKTRFEQGYKHTATERLKGAVNRKVQQMVRRNRTRMNFLETFQRMIDEYNAGSVNVDELFHRLMAFVADLDVEEQRGIAEQLREEELAIFDLLTKPAVDLTDQERETVRLAAKDLLETLKREKLVLDWRKRQQTREAVRQSIRSILDAQLPDSYDEPLYEQKCDAIYQHIYESYFGSGNSIYGSVA